jgi:hypothetical protein
MEYLIATIVIMLFCITALAQERSSEGAVIIARDKPKPLKPDNAHAKHTIKHMCGPAFTGLPKFPGQLCFDVIPITGGRAVSLHLPASYGSITELFSPWRNHYAPDISIRQASIWLYYCYLSLNKFIWQCTLFCRKKITT